MSYPDVQLDETAPELAARCVCGGCDATCARLPFKPCCGACMDDSPYRQEEITWPLDANEREQR